MGNGQGRETRLAKKACETERNRTYGAQGDIANQSVGVNFTSAKKYDVNDCVAGHLEKGTFEKKKKKKEDKKCTIM